MNNLLSGTDYEKLIHFAATIARPTKNIRSTIQHELAVQFGYDQSIFWFADDKGNITNPNIHSLNNALLREYIDEFSNFDILHPKKNLDVFSTRRALRLADLTTFTDYEKSSYYQDFMKTYGYYDEMVVTLENEGVCVGVIGFVRKTNETLFNSKDCKIFQLLSNLIGTTFSHHSIKEQSLLSTREMEVVKLIKEGKTNQETAKELFISVNTVKKHLQNIFQKYKVQNKTQLVQKV